MVTINRTPDSIVNSWKGQFCFKREIGSSKGLRSPQIGALHAILAHIETDDDKPAIVVMPTGTGKTETMLSFMVANLCKKLLIIVPSDALRTQIADKFETLGMLPIIGVVPETIAKPIVKKITSSLTTEEWESVLDSSNVVVTTMALASGIEPRAIKIIADRVSYLMVDEAHHSKAQTWISFINYFPANKILLFTATPYRNDGKKLRGKFIYNFSLRQAQEQGYYDTINYLPILEYTKEDADKAIAKRAVEQLEGDCSLGYDHILMARCKDKKRANEVFEIYKKYSQFNPIVVYSGIENGSKRLNNIKDGKHRIIVCVNMLGEGYDLPQLKIAAIHDEKQSLAITLQFIGRFTRTQGKKYGNASFITNIAYPPIAEEINRLYQYDADWNCILPRLSESSISKEKDLEEFLSDINGDLSEDFSLMDIHPALSAVVYTTETTTTYFSNWEKGLCNANSYDIKKYATSNDMLVVVLGKFIDVKWGGIQNVRNLTWDIIVVYFDAIHRRAFINSSLDLNADIFMSEIFERPEKIEGEQMFRVFANIDRIRLNQFGAKPHQGKDVSYQSFVGQSVQDAIDDLTQGKFLKNNLFGIGYKLGRKSSIGCSLKGKVWSREHGNLLEFKKWCNEIGKLITDDSINFNAILKNTLKSEIVESIPQGSTALTVDWNHQIYERGNLVIRYGRDESFFDEYDLSVVSNDSTGILFSLSKEGKLFEIEFSINNGDGKPICSYIRKNGDLNIPLEFIIDSKVMLVNEFFCHYSPTFFFADNSTLDGFYRVEPRNEPDCINDSLIQTRDWKGVNIKHESQKSEPYITDSIQYYMIRNIEDKYNFIVDDDGSGEIADIIGINSSETEITIDLYHLKYANDGKVSNDINNLYVVCGQAQKCLRWKYTPGDVFFKHILSRNQIRIKRNESARIIKGCEKDIVKLREQAWNRKEMKFRVFIVQPGMSKANATKEIKQLLGCTLQYLKQVANIPLQVICSE
jgi:superfamily II DNA or RNA helicase